MKPIKFILIGIFLGSLIPTCVQGQETYRPCGPQSLPPGLKRLMRQGAAGADFRPACQRHDNCYDTFGMPKATCDRIFYQDMLNRCANSRNPALCRFHAQRMHRATVLLGGKAYKSGQELGKQTLTGSIMRYR